MPDAEAACRAREPAVGDERYLVPHALAIYGRRGREHFAHARPTARTLVPDHEDLARLVVPLLDRREALLLALEDARGSAEFQALHARDLHDCPLRREVTLEADDTASRRERRRRGPHHVLVLRHDHIAEVLRHGPPGDRQAIAMEKAAIEERLHQDRHAADLVEVLRDIAA